MATSQYATSASEAICNGLNRTGCGLDLTGPDQTGPDQTGPDWTEPDWTRLDWTGLRLGAEGTSAM